MFANRHEGTANGNGYLAGLGSNLGPQPYHNTLVRGYGWGRIIDLDDPFLTDTKPVAVEFDRIAKLLTRSFRNNRWN